MSNIQQTCRCISIYHSLSLSIDRTLSTVKCLFLLSLEYHTINSIKWCEGIGVRSLTNPMLRIKGLKKAPSEKLFLRIKYQDVFWGALKLRFSMCFQFVIGSIPPKNRPVDIWVFFNRPAIRMVHHSRAISLHLNFSHEDCFSEDEYRQVANVTFWKLPRDVKISWRSRIAFRDVLKGYKPKPSEPSKPPIMMNDITWFTCHQDSWNTLPYTFFAFATMT